MVQKVIAIHDLTVRRLGRVYINSVQRQRIVGLDTYFGEYPNTTISSGGWRSPGFSRTAMIVVLVDPGELRDHENMLGILNSLLPFMYPTQKLLFIEHTGDVPNIPPPNLQLARGGERLWRRESWILNHYTRMQFNLCDLGEPPNLKLFSSHIMDIYLNSWPLSGDGSWLGRNLLDVRYRGSNNAVGDGFVLGRGLAPPDGELERRIASILRRYQGGKP